MPPDLKRIPAKFFCTATGFEPVRQWLKELDKADRITVGRDICDVEFSWPIGMPLCRSLKGYKDLWEVCSKITHGRIALSRILRGGCREDPAAWIRQENAEDAAAGIGFRVETQKGA